MKFLDPEKVLFQTGLQAGQVVADLGAGSGFYAIASAKIVGPGGQVYVVDVMETALNHVASEARVKGLRNIKTFRGDLELPQATAALPSGSADLVILANVLHQIKNKAKLFEDAYRLLKTGGKILVVDWNKAASPFGPSSQERVDEETVKDLAHKKVLTFLQSIAADPYHYGLIFRK